jgi:hypothetical protein
MRATLAGRENGVVDALLEVLCVLEILAEEDETSTGPTEGLVGGRGDDIAVLEGVVELLRRDETAGVGDVGHEEGALTLGNGLQRLVVPVAGVGGGTADDETRLKELGLVGEVLVVDELGLGGDTVGERLEVDGRRRHLFLGSLRGSERVNYG